MRKIHANITEDCYIIEKGTRELIGEVGKGSRLYELTNEQLEAIRYSRSKHIGIRGNIDSMDEYSVHFS